jgi:hypothetical protein
MVSEQTASEVVQLIRSLHPNASSDELSEAQRSLTEYVAAVLRIFDRIHYERDSDSRDDEDRSRIRVANSTNV